MSALARKIAQYLAKNQVKKAARLEADQVARQYLWRVNEEFTMQQLRVPRGVQKITAEELHRASADAYEQATARSAQVLRQYGYEPKAARQLAERLAKRANNDIWTATESNKMSRPPTIVPPKKKTQLPVLKRAAILGQDIQALNTKYMGARSGDIVEMNGQLYMRTLGHSNRDPSWIRLEAGQRQYRRGEDERGMWADENERP